MKRIILSLGMVVATLSVLAASALAGEWSLSLTASPAVAGSTVTLGGTLMNPSGTEGVPNKSVVVRAYGHDSTCTGTYAELGPVMTSKDKGDHGKYVITDSIPGNAAGAYYVQAYATVDDRTIVSDCVLVPVAWSTTGTIDSASATGATVTLPRAGTYRIDVSGTWDNGPWWGVDADYVQQCPAGGGLWDGVSADGWCPGGVQPDAWLATWPGYANFGNVMVNGSYATWGAFSASHAYSLQMPLGTSVNLTVFDSGYTDNVGSLAYTITYVGP